MNMLECLCVPAGSQLDRVTVLFVIGGLAVADHQPMGLELGHACILGVFQLRFVEGIQLIECLLHLRLPVYCASLRFWLLLVHSWL